jgi:hypothetical protein
LPDGAVVVGEHGEARLVCGQSTWAFSFDGWSLPLPRTDDMVDVITPPTSVAALRHGFMPVLHRSARP